MGVRLKKCRRSWYVFIYHNGQRKAKQVGTREAAEKVRREIEARLAMGDLGVLSQEASGIPTLADYVASWQRNYAAREMKPSTAHFYDQFLRLYVLPTFGNTPLDHIRRDAVKRWITALTARGLARNTVRLAIASMRSVLNVAIEDGLILANPAQRLGRMMKSEKPERQATALTAEEVTRLLNGAKQFCPKHYPFFMTAVRAGLREGELVALRWGDMRFGSGEEHDGNRYLLVQRTYDRRTRRFLTTKSKRPRRVDMSQELRDVLLKLRDQKLVEVVRQGRASIENDFVFPSEAGTFLDITNLVPRHCLTALACVASVFMTYATHSGVCSSRQAPRSLTSAIRWVIPASRSLSIHTATWFREPTSGTLTRSTTWEQTPQNTQTPRKRCFKLEEAIPRKLLKRVARLGRLELPTYRFEVSELIFIESAACSRLTPDCVQICA
jgi:integrase